MKQSRKDIKIALSTWQEFQVLKIENNYKTADLLLIELIKNYKEANKHERNIKSRK